jgi:tetratricopeptide (TPR) repeat protein
VPQPPKDKKQKSSKGRVFDPTERRGINAVDSAVLDLDWIAREQTVSDFGIDFQVETTTLDGEPTARLLALQVKSGPSYFTSEGKTHVPFYVEEKHIKYWGDHSLPTILVLYDHSRKLLVWALTSSAVKVGKSNGWRIDVPLNQVFDTTVRDEWFEIARVGKAPTPEAAKALSDQVEASANASEETPTSTVGQAVVVRTASSKTGVGTPSFEQDQAFTSTQLAQFEELLSNRFGSVRDVISDERPEDKTDPSNPRASEDAALHARIDALRDIKNGGAPDAAFRQLKTLVPTIDRAANPHAFYRAVTNLGATALDLGDYETAIERFLEAATLEPSNPLAVANSAAAEMLQKNYKAAFELAGKAIEMDAKPSHAMTIRLQVAAHLQAVGGPLELLPEALRDSDEAQLGLIEFYRVKDDPRWTKLARSLADQRPANDQFVRAAAYAVLELASADRQGTEKAKSDVGEVEIRNAAAVLKAEVEKSLTFTHFNREDTAAQAANVAVAYRIVDDIPAALAFLRHVVDRLPEPPLLRVLGIVESLSGDQATAKARLASLTDDGEAQLVLSEMEARDDPKGALARALAIKEEALPDEYKVTRWLVAADLAVLAKDDKALNEALAEIGKQPSYAPAVAIHHAQRQFRMDADKDALRSNLVGIAAFIPDDAPLIVRLTLSSELQEVNAYLEASRVLDGWVDATKNSPATRGYLQALASSGRDTDFLAALEKLPQTLKDDASIVWLQTVHAYNSGDLKLAEKNARKLVLLKPNDLASTLLLSEILGRRRDQRGLAKTLAGQVEAFSGTLENKLRLGRLLFHNGQYARSMALLYQLLLENRDNHSVWLTFGSSVVEAGRRKGAPKLAMKTVQPDATVELKFEGGTNNLITVESDAEYRRLDDEALELEHRDVMALLGKKKNDTFTLPDGRKGVVGNIQHKYIAKTQRVFAEYEKRFPAAAGLHSITVDTKREGGLDGMIAVLKERAEYVEGEAKHYEAGETALAVFAYRVGVDPIDAAGGLFETGRKFQVAVGSEDERAAAHAAILANGTRGFVVDAQTYWTLWRLRGLDAFEAGFGKLHYGVHTLDVLHARSERLESAKRQGHRTISFKEGRIHLDEMPAEQVKSAKADIDAAIAWLEAHGVESPAYLPNDLSDELVRVLNDLPMPILDELLIAKQQNLLLLVDDLVLRKLGQGIGGIRSAWLHWAIGELVEEGLIDEGRYLEWSAALIEAGQSYLGLSAAAFIAALKADVAAGRSAPGPTFESLVKVIGGTGADLRSHIRVAVQIIRTLWQNNEFAPVTQPATGKILWRLILDRSADTELILGVALRLFRNDPFIFDYVIDWIKGHFLKMPGKGLWR